MKKLFKTLIIALLASALIICINYGAEGQTPSPTTTSSDSSEVIFDDKPIFTIKEKLGFASTAQRADRINKRLVEFADNYAFSVEELHTFSGDAEGIPLSGIVGGNLVIINISDGDAKAVGKTRKDLAEEFLQKIKTVVKDYRQERSLQSTIRGAIISGVVTIGLIITLLVSNNIFSRIYQSLKNWGNTYIRAIRVGNLELIKANQLDNLIIFITKIIQIFLLFSLFIIYVPFILSQFPWTEGLSIAFWKYLSGSLQHAVGVFINYLPSLLTVIIVIFFTWTLLRLSRPFFHELHQGSFSIPGFYSEWAWPTYRLVTVLTIALSAVIVFPLLPGFTSPAFQGISVFLGLLVSLGSTSVISNMISGSVLIYTRAFRVGDRIKVGEIFGTVIETTLLVTRILTPTNIVISIPNSEIITSSIENLNFAAKELDKPLIIRTTIYLGYEVPWREAYKALTAAAERTEGVAKSPEPFVLQHELNEVYVTYLLSVYIDHEFLITKTAKELEGARSRLHENIRDCCQEMGITIFAPSYEADPMAYGPVATE